MKGAAVIVGLRSPPPGLLDELRGLGGDAGEADDVGVPDHRQISPPGTETANRIYIIMVDDVAAVHAGVDDGEVLGAWRGPDNDVVVGDLDAQGLVLAPQGTAAVMSPPSGGLVWALVDFLVSIFRGDGLAHRGRASGAPLRVPGSTAALAMCKSSVVILPLGPVPVRPERSMPWMRAWLAASGVSGGLVGDVVLHVRSTTRPSGPEPGRRRCPRRFPPGDGLWEKEDTLTGACAPRQVAGREQPRR